MHKHLAEARIAKGLTQAEVAAAIGRDQSLVSRYESGKSRIDVEVAPKLAAVLGVDLLTVLYGPDAAEIPEGEEAHHSRRTPAANAGAAAEAAESVPSVRAA